MSFGRPPSFTTFSAPPPDRGSFPLDHDGECSVFMKEYLTCLKQNQNNNGKCRDLSKKYLACRMDKGLMGQEDFKNLGYRDMMSTAEEEAGKYGSTASASSSLSSASQCQSTSKLGTGSGPEGDSEGKGSSR